MDIQFEQSFHCEIAGTEIQAGIVRDFAITGYAVKLNGIIIIRTGHYKIVEISPLLMTIKTVALNPKIRIS